MAEQIMNARALTQGTILNGQYVIEGIIGEGGFGITYLGMDLFLKIKVAIKEYFPVQYASRNTQTGNSSISIISGERTELYRKGLHSYEYEANKLTKFEKLKGIVSVLNFFYENNTAYMVMEYIEGVTLKQYLEEYGGKIPWKETLEMMHPVIDSLKQVHEAGIIHRDISPDNIMISESKRITIIDFGAARNEESEKSKTIMLKKGYAPPEQYFKNGHQGSWTDVYALCATVYRMITGERLPESLSVKAGNSHYEPISNFVPDIPKNIEKTLFRGLAIEIEDRISTMEILEEYLYKETRLKLSVGQRRRYIKIAIGTVSLVIAVVIATLLGRSLLQKIPDSVQTNPAVLGELEAGQTKTGEIESGENQTEEPTISEKMPVSGEETVAVEVLPERYQSIPEIPVSSISYENAGSSITITGLDSAVTDVMLPTEIEGLPVTQIEGVGVNVTNVVIPSGTESLGQYAFKNCVYLEAVYLPDTLKQIASGAFDNCQSLQAVDVSPQNEDFYVEGNSLYAQDGTLIVSW